MMSGMFQNKGSLTSTLPSLWDSLLGFFYPVLFCKYFTLQEKKCDFVSFSMKYIFGIPQTANYSMGCWEGRRLYFSLLCYLKSIDAKLMLKTFWWYPFWIKVNAKEGTFCGNGDKVQSNHFSTKKIIYNYNPLLE